MIARLVLVVGIGMIAVNASAGEEQRFYVLALDFPGAYSFEDEKEVVEIIHNKDRRALVEMAVENRTWFLKAGTIVYIEQLQNDSSGREYAKVRPRGATTMLWFPANALKAYR
jgi:hypothetical protein